MDPCLDDCIMLAKKFKTLGVNVGLDVLNGLPHGFLSFVKVNKFFFLSLKIPNKNEFSSNSISFYLNFSYQKKPTKEVKFV